jgi:K(+)-stimulated pyrophosphate-energized sodium pump
MLNDVAIWATWAGIAGLAIALIIYTSIRRSPVGTDAMRAIADQIRSGAMAFLKREYSVLAPFVIVVALLLRDRRWFTVALVASTVAMGAYATLAFVHAYVP